jgi:hypothetical protein
MINPQFETPPALLYAAGIEYDWFGSNMEYYPPEAIAAIHDACDFVQPNVYDNNRANEARDLAAVRTIGADGAMVNHPDLAADVLDLPVDTTIEIAGSKACLGGHHGLGLPGKILNVGGTEMTTRRGGCVELPASYDSITFAGDSSTLASSI